MKYLFFKKKNDNEKIIVKVKKEFIDNSDDEFTGVLINNKGERVSCTIKLKKHFLNKYELISENDSLAYLCAKELLIT